MLLPELRKRIRYNSQSVTKVCFDNYIEDLSILEGATNLSNLSFDKLGGLYGLPNFIHLESLAIKVFPLLQVDTTPLSTLTSLRSLKLNNPKNNKHPVDTDFIVKLTKLQKLKLIGNVNVNLDLISLINLGELKMVLCNVTSVSFSMCKLHSLRKLTYQGNTEYEKDVQQSRDYLRVLECISGSFNLESLVISSNRAVGLSGLVNVPNLLNLKAGWNYIRNIEHFKSFTSLRTLGLGNNSIQDVSSIRYLTNLEKLNLTDNRIKDITPLSALDNLQYVSLRYNAIDTYNPLSKLINLDTLKIGSIVLPERYDCMIGHPSVEMIGVNSEVFLRQNCLNVHNRMCRRATLFALLTDKLPTLLFISAKPI